LDLSTALKQEVSCSLVSEYQQIASLRIIYDTFGKPFLGTFARAIGLAFSRRLAASANRTVKVVGKMRGQVIDGNGFSLPVATRLTIRPIILIVCFLTIDSWGGSGRTASSG
jgi:hypothetical protein